jgi:hypothetical protein
VASDVTAPRPPRVFISYAHDSDAHREKVRDLWVFLCANGVEAHIDRVAAQERHELDFSCRRPGWYASTGGRGTSRSTSATRDGEHKEQEADPAEDSHPDKIAAGCHVLLGAARDALACSDVGRVGLEPTT